MNSKIKYINSSGINIWTEILVPEGNSVPCLFIAGAGASAMFWSDEFCQHFYDAGFSVIRFDHRDVGLTDEINWDNHPYTIEDLAKDAIAILDAYQIQKAHIVGHSMGGIVAQWLAIQNPERLLSFSSLSVATSGITGQSPKEIMDVLLENKPTQNFERDLPAFMQSWAILNGNYPVDESLAKAYTQDLYKRIKHPVGVAWHHIWCQKNYIDLRAQLKNIKTPGLFIHGELDPLISLHAAIETQKAAYNSKMLVIKDMGHMIFNKTLQEEIAQALIAYFKKCK